MSRNVEKDAIFNFYVLDFLKKIFDAFDSLAKMGYKLNIAIAYLFDDQEFTKYIEEKILLSNEKKSRNRTKSML